MKELEQIKNNTQGEIPSGQKTVVRVLGISNASEVLEDCKKIMIGFLINRSVDYKSKKWNSILPRHIVSFLESLSQEERSEDEFFYTIPSLIEDLQGLKEWEWFSSQKINANGFEIIFKGCFYPRFLWIIHAQRVPLSTIWIEDDRFGSYQPVTFRDITLDKD